MKELSIQNLSKSYGVKQLVDQVDFSIRTGDRVGLIGPNGTGKSSFLRVIAGIDTYDSGQIKTPNDYEIAYLEQNPRLDPAKTILETVYDSEAADIQLLLAYEKCRMDLESDPTNQSLQDQFTQLSDQMTLKSAWEVEIAAKSILTQLKIYDLNKKVGQCSGGQQKRIGIAQVLIAEPDLLILDEPTNHLDVDSIRWLEKYLAAYQGALLLVTHDRYFLERSVNKIIELQYGRITEFEGNYQTYLTKKAELIEMQTKQAQKQDRLYLQELAWMRQGAQARSTKQQARIDRFNQLKDSIGQRDQAQEAIEFNFSQQRMGNQIIELEDVRLEIANHLILDGLTKTFVKGDRLGVVGPNGVGKSTFLNSLAGLHAFTSGECKLGQTVSIAYYRQLDEDLPNDMRILTYLTQVADQFKRPDGSKVSASQMLERFNFPKETHGSLIQSLSGGERRRLYLLTLLIQEPNVLLLDEPTNDLDIETLNTLEDYIDRFEGVVIIVSHDRYFLDKTVDQLLVMHGQGKFDVFWGTFSEYLENTDQKTSNIEKTKQILPKESIANQNSTKKKRMTYQEKQEWQDIEERIHNVEVKIEEGRKMMETYANDAVKLMDLHQEIEKLETDLLALYERYDYLSDLA
ncbi:ABC-F family ATP-binding cassette domain-containing protein [Facklamia miroungae]|uniref:ATP-binding cassette, subfamily F, uup n=1 Tax=Facklamia miroungae TaxID=120956 RepID=A0A1G7P8E5_9LACT|nr:ABC-F family ATP-binding cassette domain-containing protein [Facklamia miroungae]NKZ28598.1 ABC-F family ATP-binding cassette domain-containing protein [Facklamia miroungae]SDF81869.1 ATP-binding cassette, subfamily F, uup [Facklamia miroungae]